MTPEFGFYSNDGALVPLTQLNTASLAYVSYTTQQLQQLLQEKIKSELYEQCAQIRDELQRRIAIN
ncbi:hypothetical protein ACFQZX_08535 [Mucilaginibacter litoreus]|uniref:Uncharacterized protein n=1 Tax=Mucilaginibacter litoreus TaxID=1048221 RepID=A0ABW3ARX2_9SPHI